MKQITFSRAAERSLRKMPANTARLIRSKIGQYAAEPSSLGNNVKALKGAHGYYRLRIGDWRVIFREDGAVVAIVEIGVRGGVYDRGIER